MSNIYIWHFSEAFRWFEGIDEQNEALVKKRNLVNREGKWTKPTLQNASEQGLTKPSGDFPSTIGYCHLVSEAVVRLLGGQLEKSGELLPVEIVDDDVSQDFFLFQCTRVIDCLDTERSELTYSPIRPNKIAYIKDPVFLPNKLPHEGLFVVPEKIGGHVYVTEEIKASVKQHGLKGMVLIKKPFGDEPAWIS